MTGSCRGSGPLRLACKRGVEMLQFVIGGLQGELSFTSLLNPAENQFSKPCSRAPGRTTETEGLRGQRSRRRSVSQQGVLPPPLTPAPVNLASLEVHLSTTV